MMMSFRWLFCYSETWPANHEDASRVLDVVDVQGLDALGPEDRQLWDKMTQEMETCGGMEGGHLSTDVEYGLLNKSLIQAFDQAALTFNVGELWRATPRGTYVQYAAEVYSAINNRLAEVKNLTIREKRVADQIVTKVYRLLYIPPNATQMPLPLFCSEVVDMLIELLKKVPKSMKEVSGGIASR
jgi:hypothetical protein